MSRSVTYWVHGLYNAATSPWMRPLTIGIIGFKLASKLVDDILSICYNWAVVLIHLLA